MLWLKTIEKNVVLDMDNIEQLLEGDVKSLFAELMHTLRKNSQQHLQILTTTRTEFTNRGQTSVNHKIGELDEISSVELLRECCSNEVETTYLSELAYLCGFVPLALCIVGTILPELDDPSELIQWLREKPMETLRNSDQCVEQAIEFSFQKLSEEDQKGFICLSVFDGDFQRKSAEEVIEKNELKTQRFLSNLVTRSLVQKTSDRRYVIHSLIRRFLADHDQFQYEKAMAQGLMVSHFLQPCNSLTMDSYSYNRFTSARESLKKDVHNVEKTLKICSQNQATDLNQTIREILAKSDIYKCSYRFFHSFSWDLLTETVLTNFSESCIKLAESRNQPAIVITFQHQVASQEGHKSGRKSAEYTERIEAIMALFQTHKAVLKEDRYLYVSCYNLLARYYLNKEPYKLPTELKEDERPSFPEVGEQNPNEKVAEVYILMKFGNLDKILAHKAFYENKEKKKRYMKSAEEFYNQALSLATDQFGDHRLICILRKLLGDLYFDWHENNKALTYYTRAINLNKKLKFDSNEHFATLLKNCGTCLAFVYRFNESVKVLKKARDIIDKLTEKHTPCRAIVYCNLAISCSFWAPDCQEAEKYAEEAMKMKKFLEMRDVKKMREIIERAKDYPVVQSIVKPLQDIVKVQQNYARFRLNSCIPDKKQTFIGLGAMVKQIISSLVEDDCGIVSIVGEPGFGKSTVAIEVSHQLIKGHDITVIFSFLSHVSTVPEVITRLCHDVGVIPGEDPESSLMLWLKTIKKKAVLVMDNIEQLLENDVKTHFVELVHTLRKNSPQHLQILTTTRTEFLICGQTTTNHKISGLDEMSSVELLRECCSIKEVKNEYLSELSKLCDFIPLALCIAGRTIPHLEDPSELIRWLRAKPIEALKNSDRCVQQVIEFSFQKLCEEDQKGLVCLLVFDGDFHSRYAKEIVGRSDLDTLELLKNLVSRGLIQEDSDKRFVIHSLIRQFLADHDQFQNEKIMAQSRMVRHFLKMCDSLAVDYYSYDGFTSARDSLKKNVQNIETTLKICTQDQRANLSPNILELLTSSDVYKSPPNFFYSFSLNLLSRVVLGNFFESSIKLAKSRQQPSIEITFQCLLAHLECRKSPWKSREYSEYIRAAFHENKVMLKEQRLLFMFCYFFLARYDSRKPRNAPPADLPEDDFPALPDTKEPRPSTIERVAEARILIERGNLFKNCAKNELHEDKEKYNEYMNNAKSFYNQALSFVKEWLGNHELTCVLHERLGDLFYKWHENEQALNCYTNAISVREGLALDSNEQFVLLLKDCGACLSYLRHYHKSVKTLLEARDIADNLTEKHAFCRTQVYCELANTCRHWRRSEFSTT